MTRSPTKDDLQELPCDIPKFTITLPVYLLLYFKKVKSSVIRQRGESQNGGNKKAKHGKLPCTCADQGIRNIHFSENVFAFLPY